MPKSYYAVSLCTYSPEVASGVCHPTKCQRFDVPSKQLAQRRAPCFAARPLGRADDLPFAHHAFDATTAALFLRRAIDERVGLARHGWWRGTSIRASKNVAAF